MATLSSSPSPLIQTLAPTTLLTSIITPTQSSVTIENHQGHSGLSFLTMKAVDRTPNSLVEGALQRPQIKADSAADSNPTDDLFEANPGHIVLVIFFSLPFLLLLVWGLISLINKGIAKRRWKTYCGRNAAEHPEVNEPSGHGALAITQPHPVYDLNRRRQSQRGSLPGYEDEMLPGYDTDADGNLALPVYFLNPPRFENELRRLWAANAQLRRQRAQLRR